MPVARIAGGLRREEVAVDHATVRPIAGAPLGVEADALVRRLVEAEQPIRHPVGGGNRQVTPVCIVTRPVDHVVFAAAMLEGETHRERLHVIRLGVALGVGLAGLGDRLGAGDVLRTRQWQQVAKLGGVGEVGRTQHDVVRAAAMPYTHRLHAVTVHVGRDRCVVTKDAHVSTCHIRREHGLNHGEGDPRFTSDARHPAVAGIEPRVGRGARNEGCLRAVVVTHAGP